MESDLDVWIEIVLCMRISSNIEGDQQTCLSHNHQVISFIIGLLNQFIHKLREVQSKTALRILVCIKNSPGKGLVYEKYGHVYISTFSDTWYTTEKCDWNSTTGYMTYVEGNLVTWNSKKEDVVSRSLAEAEHQAMMHTTCELTKICFKPNSYALGLW